VESRVELRLEPTSDRYDAADDRWLDQVAAFVSELRSEVGDVDVQREPVAGAKGFLDTIVLPLASAGAVTGTIEMLKAWLGRDRSRSVKVTWAADGGVQQLELAGNSVDDAEFDRIVNSVAQQLQGPR
jgi:hypothetical protein